MAGALHRLAGVAVGRGIQIGAALLVTVLIARWLPPADAGAAVLALAVAALAAALGELGLARTLIRAIAAARANERHGEADAWLRAAALWACGAGLAVAVVAGCAVLPFAALRGSALPVALMSGGVAAIGVLAGALRGDDRPGMAAFLSNACLPLLQLASLVVLWWTQHLAAGPLLWCWGIGSAAIAGLAALAIALGFRHAGPSPTPLPDLVRRAAPAWGVSIAATAFGQLDVILAGWVLPADALATYGIANRLAAVLGLGLVFFNQSCSAQIVALHAQGRNRELSRLLVVGSAWATALAAAVWLGVMLGGKPIARLTLGEHYLAALPLFALLGLRQIASCALGSAAHVLNLCWDQWRLVWWSLGTLALWCVLAAGGGLLWSAPGLAIGGLIGFVIYKAILAWIAARRLGARSGIIAPAVHHEALREIHL